MADNFVTDAGAGGNTYASDDITGVHYPILKIAYGALDSATLVSTSNGFPVAQQGTWNIGTVTTVTTLSTITNVVHVDDNAGSLTVDNAVLSVVGGGTEAAAQRVTIASDSTGVLSVDDNGGSLTVDGTVAVSGSVAVTNAGTFVVQENGAALTSLQLIDDTVVADDAAFTPATTKVIMSGFTFDDVAPDSVNEGDAGAARMSANRNIYTTLRDAAGNERGANVNASNQLSVSVDNTVTVGSHAVTNAGTFAVQVDGAALTSLQLLDDTVFAEDVASAPADKGIGILAVRNDAGTALVGTTGDYTFLSTDSAGALRVTGGGGGTQYNIDDVASATAAGTVALVVRKDTGASLAGTDGDITGLQVDANGALRVTGGGGGTEYTVDAAAPAAPTGATFVMERDDALSALTEIEGDWTNPRASANGALWVSVDGTVTVGSHAVTNAGTFAVQESGAALTALQLIDNLVLAEDAIHGSGDPGVMALGVRKATPADLSSADGDYEPFQVSGGRLWVDASGKTLTVASHAVTNAGTFAVQADPGTAANWGVYVEDAAETAGGNLVMAGAVRRDTAASSSGTTGDNSTLNTNNIGALWVAGTASTNAGWSVATGSIAATKTDIGSANTAGNVAGWYFYNPNASVAYVQFFNAQASAVTLGTTAPIYSLGIPATSAANVAPGMVGISHSTAISIAVTTTRAGSTGPGSTVDYNIWYKQ